MAVSESTLKEIKLRNFRLPNETYFWLEFIAEHKDRDANAELLNTLKEKIDAFKKKHGYTEVQLTERRKKRLAQ